MQNCGSPLGEVSTLLFYWPAGVGGGKSKDKNVKIKITV